MSETTLVFALRVLALVDWTILVATPADTVVVKSQARGGQVRRQILLLLNQREVRGQHTPPTVREIAAAIGRSPSTIHRHIKILTESGGLEPRLPGLARTIRLRRGDES